jgi:hypothetical protein
MAAQAPAQYGRQLNWTSQPVEAECPPEDIYNFVIKSVSDPEEKPGFNPGDVDIQVYAETELYGYPYDPDDEDDMDWNGTTCRVYCVLGRIYAKKPDIVSPVWKSERSNARPFLEAIFPEWDWTSKNGLQDQPIDLGEWEGRKFRAVVKPNDKGWPRLSGFMVAKPGGKKKKAAAPPPVEDDDDDELYQDEE